MSQRSADHDARCDWCGEPFTVPETPPGGWGVYAAPTRLCPDHLAVWRAERDQIYAKAEEIKARHPQCRAGHHMDRNGHERDLAGLPLPGEPACLNCQLSQSEIDAEHLEFCEFVETMA